VEPASHPPTPARRVEDEAEAPEVHLGELARRALGPAYREPAAILEAAALGRVAVQRGVGDGNALAGQQRVGLREPQPALALLRRQPLAQQLAMRVEKRLELAPTCRFGRLGPKPLRDLRGQRLVGFAAARLPAELRRRLQIAADRLAGPARDPLDRRLRLPAVMILRNDREAPPGVSSRRPQCR
jgi:hypothetical protein